MAIHHRVGASGVWYVGGPGYRVGTTVALLRRVFAGYGYARDPGVNVVVPVNFCGIRGSEGSIQKIIGPEEDIPLRST